MNNQFLKRSMLATVLGMSLMGSAQAGASRQIEDFENIDISCKDPKSALIVSVQILGKLVLRNPSPFSVPYLAYAEAGNLGKGFTTMTASEFKTRVEVGVQIEGQIPKRNLKFQIRDIWYPAPQAGLRGVLLNEITGASNALDCGYEP